MDFELKINLDNAAFEHHGNDVELSRILLSFAKTIYFAKLEKGCGNLYDVNGNKVGSWKITEKEIENV